MYENVWTLYERELRKICIGRPLPISRFSMFPFFLESSSPQKITKRDFSKWSRKFKFENPGYYAKKSCLSKYFLIPGRNPKIAKKPGNNETQDGSNIDLYRAVLMISQSLFSGNFCFFCDSTSRCRYPDVRYFLNINKIRESRVKNSSNYIFCFSNSYVLSTKPEMSKIRDIGSITQLQRYPLSLLLAKNVFQETGF